MPQYITPDRYRNMALGVDLSAKTDFDLVALAQSASAEINRYCAAPRNHDFRGGTITAEEHLWNVGNAMKRPSGRLWPIHGMGVMPITSCSQIDIYTTKTNYIRFTPANIFVNGRLGYVEPVAAPITTALFTSIPPWLLTSPVAYIDYTYGWEFGVTDELIVSEGGRVYHLGNQFIVADSVTIEVDGVPNTNFTVDLVEGTITFTSIQDARSQVLASYKHKLPSDIPLATALVMTDMLGYSNINASGLTGLSGIRVEEIELRQSSKVGFAVYDMHPAARPLLNSYTYVSFA